MARKPKDTTVPVAVVAPENSTDGKELAVVEQMQEVAPAANTANTLEFKIGIDQTGLDVDGAVTDRLFFDIRIVKDAETLDIATISANLGRQIWAGISHLNTKRKGFNVTFLVNNTLTQNYTLKAKGKLRFSDARNCIFSVLRMMAAQFDDTNAVGYITGDFKQSDEITLLLKQMGIKAANLPWEVVDEVVDLKRKRIGKQLSEGKRTLIASYK